MLKLSILMVSDTFYPDTTGGSEIVIYEISKRLVNRGHNVYVLTRRFDESLPVEDEVKGIHVHRYSFSPDGSLRINRSIIRNVRQDFERLAQDVSFDILHFHHTLASLGVHLSSISRALPRVCNFYAPLHEEYLSQATESGLGARLKAFLRQRAEKFNLNRCQAIVTLSEYSKQQLEKVHGSNLIRRVKVIPGAVDDERFKPVPNGKKLREELDIPSKKVVLLSIRRLVPRMGLDVLIEAMVEVSKECSDILLIIGGEGPERERLQALRDNLGLQDRIRFVGYIKDDLLPTYYQVADLFVLPSRGLEGFGLVTLEALSCGTPVLGSAMGATSEILSKFNEELLITDLTPQGLAKAILVFVSNLNYFTPEFKASCRQFVLESYSWDRAVEKIEELYEKLLREI